MLLDNLFTAMGVVGTSVTLLSIIAVVAFPILGIVVHDATQSNRLPPRKRANVDRT